MRLVSDLECGHNGAMMAWLSLDGGAGSLIDLERARLSVLDRAVTVGAGVFETIKVTDGRPFALSRHLERLQRSAAALAVEVPDFDHIRSGVEAVIASQQSTLGPLGRMRITVTAGAGTLADPYADAGPPGWFITLTSLPAWPDSAVVEVSQFRRNAASALAGVKSTSYAENAIALHRAHRQGADEALLLNTTGEVCEGTGSNIFLVVDDVLCTPPLASGCLAGVTRALVLECTDAQERAVPQSELALVTEAFLTSSTRDIWPIRSLSGATMPAPGQHTIDAMKAWNAQIAPRVDP